ncbi:MAG: hypothetical protein M9962_02040 [Oligoflexia bacterium]|nr:hypothetical protein [Oligoflexia bacterium]
MNSIWLLSVGYFLSYIATGMAIKFFTGSIDQGFYGLSSMEYLVYSTAFSSLFCVMVVLAKKWHLRAKLTKNELWVLFLSGLCTAYIIPASTLIMSLPISIMIAMVLMRGTVIVASRIVDLILNIQNLQKKVIPWQEEVAVLFAITAVAIKLFFAKNVDTKLPSMGVALLICYFFTYLLRLYVMNRSKISGLAGKKLDQRLYFGVEQLFASAILLLISTGLFFWIQNHYLDSPKIGQQFVDAIYFPKSVWLLASISGLPYAFIAFLSVFLFLFPGKSATFTGVLNRLVSLMGGTASSLILFLFFGGKVPPQEDWISLAFILVAIVFLAWGDLVEGKEKSAEGVTLNK